MIVLRCQCCRIAKKRKDYWQRRADLTSRGEMVHWDTQLYISPRFPTLIYCGDCLRHAQQVLSEILGESFVRSIVESDTSHLLKEFGTPMSRMNRISFSNGQEGLGWLGPNNDAEYFEHNQTSLRLVYNTELDAVALAIESD